MSEQPGGGRRQVPAFVIVLTVIVLVTVAVLWSGIGKGADPSPDQCGKPVSERVGGWMCPGEVSVTTSDPATSR
ncbi:hypothetical protein KIH74_30945 [Kineosporia sp. J2-2]|uniref:Secreted protein n=1 Tax=Kineosporia corallincola TaxID=2835133 RepID=A0ABS5TRI1_9ACTN|nr:hypothetical protein [Kineosporia corallincola]MBT0773404.1 hypothetical protein [Kineosporia corallincola]